MNGFLCVALCVLPTQRVNNTAYVSLLSFSFLFLITALAHSIVVFQLSEYIPHLFTPEAARQVDSESKRRHALSQAEPPRLFNEHIMMFSHK